MVTSSKFICAALSACAILTAVSGCSSDGLYELPATEEAAGSETAEPAFFAEGSSEAVSSAAQNYGTGLDNVTLTAAPDKDPDRKIVRSRAPIRQVRAVSISGGKLSDDFYFYRNTLSGSYQKAYDQIYAGLYKGSQTITMNIPVNYNDFPDIVYSVLYDHPELFWLETHMNYSYNGSGDVTEVTVLFNSTGSSLRQSQQNFENAVAKVLTKANTFSSDIDKVKYVHDYLTNIIDYTYNAPLNQSPYSALVLGKTVCAGYAKAFQYCMMKLEIPTAYIVGEAGESHAWNLVKLDGEYYNMDVTWDDPISNPPTTYYYNYFNVTDSVLSRDHQRYAISAQLPAANGTKYNYYNWYGSGHEGSDFSDWALINGSIASDYDQTEASTKPQQTSAPQQQYDDTPDDDDDFDFWDDSDSSYSDDDDDFWDDFDWDDISWTDEEDYPDDYFFDYDDFSDWWGDDYDSDYGWGFGGDCWD